MSKKNNDMIKKFKELAVVEKDYAVKLGTEVRGWGNEIVRDIVDSMAIDSQKHAALFKACAALLEGSNLGILEDEYRVLAENLEKHKQIEQYMIEQVDELLGKIKDERITMMLNHIKDDEIRHHALIKNVTETVIKTNVILEKDMWNQLFRDLLTHGHAPPGEWEEPE